jgi:hypothetical protein
VSAGAGGREAPGGGRRDGNDVRVGREAAGGQPGRQQLVAALGQHRLGVELDALDGQLAVPQRHDDPGRRVPGDLELVGHGGGVHGQRVVPRRRERRRQAGQDALPLVLDLTGLAVQQLGCAHHDGTEGLGDRLVAQADPQHGGALLGRRTDHRHGHAGAGGCAGSGGEQDSCDVEIGELVHVDGVVAPDDGADAELAEVLDQVVDEAVEVVDDENRAFGVGHRHPLPELAALRARRRTAGPGGHRRRAP